MKRTSIAYIVSVSIFSASLGWSAYASGNCPVDCPSTAPANMEVTKEGYPILDGWVVVEGDIMLARVKDWEASSPATRGLITTQPARRWPGGIVNYTIDPFLGPGLTNKILDAIAAVEDDTAIQFVEQANGNYIRFREHPNPGQGTCSSPVGMQGGEQFINLIQACSTGTIIHEIGHSLGMYHEHSRSDRDTFVTINTFAICPLFADQFDVISSNTEDVGPYDHGSIMHYSPCAFSASGAETIDMPAGTFQRDGLSRSDINAIAYMYGDDSDADGDGVDAATDNCLDVANPDQRDTDFDSFGNMCDADFNNDGTVSIADTGLLRAGYFSTPGAAGWHQNLDINGDDVVNVVDLGLLREQFFGEPGPSGVAQVSARCGSGELLTCPLSGTPTLTAQVTDSNQGLVTLTAGNLGLENEEVREFQWLSVGNGGVWQTSGMTVDVSAGTAVFCAPAPGTYLFRVWSYAEISLDSEDFFCDTECSASSNGVFLQRMPTCSAE